MKVVASRRYPGQAFDELDDVEVLPLDEFREPRDDVEGVVVANEPVPLDLLPRLRIVANFGVGYDRMTWPAAPRAKSSSRTRPVSSTTPRPTSPSP